MSEPQDNSRTLSDGTVFSFRPLKGKDILNAKRMARSDDSFEIGAAIAACGVLLNGKPVPLEELLELPAADYMKILAASGELLGNVAAPTSTPFST